MRCPSNGSRSARSTAASASVIRSLRTYTSPRYAARVISDGKGFVRIAQLRGRIAALARGGRYDLTLELLGDLVRADLGLGLPADALLRARHTAQLAEERGEPIA